MTYSPITPEALSGALAAVRGPMVPQSATFAVRSLADVQTTEEDPFDVDALMAAGITPHCAMCGHDLGPVESEPEAEALFHAHVPACPAVDARTRAAYSR